MGHSANRQSPVILCIMDGWGLAPAAETNAVSSADTPVFDRLMADYPNATLQASGPAVGLPEGQPGNSEVGHMNIGAGRCVLQDLPRIHNAIADDTLKDIPELCDFIDQLKASGGAAHLMGLFSDGGVHAHHAHCAALANHLAAGGIEVIIHAFTDGRDTLPQVAAAQYDDFAKALTQPVRWGTVTGRYYAMDRDNRHERTKQAFDAITTATASYQAKDYQEAVSLAYGRGESDEFISATIIDGYQGLRAGDGIFMTNFRVDRARQILTALRTPEVIGAPDSARPADLIYASMTPVFSDKSALPYLFPPQDLSNGLGETVAAAGMRQLRLAETEKYPHVTYFFNGGEEAQFTQEDRTVIPSPKVATYDLAPMMSASGVLERALQSLEQEEHELLIINFANPDMVGHTGDVKAARQAVEMVDQCVGQLVTAVEAKGGAMIITADHGNCEVMWDHEARSPHTAHTTNLVPVILVGGPADARLHDGCLADLAPSLLSLLAIPQPDVMSGKSLLSF